MNKKYIIALVIAIVAVAITAIIAIPRHAPQKTQKLPVVTSFYPLYFFAEQIGGDKIEATNITPAGAEPHDYEPTAQDLTRIENSKLLILNGGGLETWGERVQHNIDQKNTLIIIAGQNLATQHIPENGKDIADPHIWLAPPLTILMADKIEAGLAQADPDNAAYYESNARILKSMLRDLDGAYREGLANCTQHYIVTSHAAFGYLSTAYHLNQVSITGISPDTEPSPQQLAEIAKFAKNNHIMYIFFESLASPKLSQTIATEVGAQTMALNPIEGLTEDQIASGKNYFTEMRENLANLKTALQCTQ